jgi:hypothetical protein
VKLDKCGWIHFEAPLAGRRLPLGVSAAAAAQTESGRQTVKTMMNSTTYTIESVHGLKQTFSVNPNGTVDTLQQCSESLTGDKAESKTQSDTNNRPNAK